MQRIQCQKLTTKNLDFEYRIVACKRVYSHYYSEFYTRKRKKLSVGPFSIES